MRVRNDGGMLPRRCLPPTYRPAGKRLFCCSARQDPFCVSHPNHEGHRVFAWMCPTGVIRSAEMLGVQNTCSSGDWGLVWLGQIMALSARLVACSGCTRSGSALHRCSRDLPATTTQTCPDVPTSRVEFSPLENNEPGGLSLSERKRIRSAPVRSGERAVAPPSPPISSCKSTAFLMSITSSLRLDFA
jgi:hypothetical protein